MNINQAVQSLADIICKNEEEKATVLNILHLNGLSLDNDYGGLVVCLYASITYDISTSNDKSYPAIAASDFITSNTPAE